MDHATGAVAVTCVAALPRLLQAGDADDGAEGLEVVLVAALGGQNPGQGLVALVVGQFGGGGVAVGQEDEAVVLLVLVVEVDGGLEIGAAATDDTDTVDRLLGRKEGEDMDLITYVTDRAGHDLRYAIDSTKLQRELGWEPSLQFEEGIERTVRWYLDHQDWVDNVTSGEYQKYYDSMYKNR